MNPPIVLTHISSMRVAEGKSLGALLEELLLPAIEDRRLQPILVAQSGDWDPVNQMPAWNSHLVLCRVLLSLLSHRIHLHDLYTISMEAILQFHLKQYRHNLLYKDEFCYIFSSVVY